MEFEINGQNYRSAAMPTRAQFHVSRRLAPFLAQSLGALQASLKGGEGSLQGAMPEIAGALAAMSDTDCDFILDNTLSLVSRQQGERWALIFNAKAKAMQFDDITLSAMLQIAAQVVQQELGPFLQEIAASLNPSETPQAT